MSFVVVPAQISELEHFPKVLFAHECNNMLKQRTLSILYAILMFCQMRRLTGETTVTTTTSAVIKHATSIMVPWLFRTTAQGMHVFPRRYQQDSYSMDWFRTEEYNMENFQRTPGLHSHCEQNRPEVPSVHTLPICFNEPSRANVMVTFPSGLQAEFFPSAASGHDCTTTTGVLMGWICRPSVKAAGIIIVA